MTDVTNVLVFGLIVLMRIGIPLLIPRYPLPSIIASLVVDAVDQTVFQSLTTLNLDGYQTYDKALDVYYLAIAYVSTLRNWSHLLAFSISRFLWYYRLVGVTIFELVGGRVLLLIFPNTFEYFFIWYEAVRTRWNPARLAASIVVGAAAGIWIFIKLPQEYWIHIAKLDTTDVIKEDILGVSSDSSWGNAISENLWIIPVILVIGVLLYIAGRALANLLPPAEWEMTLDPGRHREFELDTVPDLSAGSIEPSVVAEKVILVGLVSVIFAQILPDVESSSLLVLVSVGIVVAANAFASTWLTNRGITWNSPVTQFGAMALLNLVVALVWIGLVTDNRNAENSVRTVVFFVLLLTLIVTLFDRYHPIYRYRLERSTVDTQTNA